MRFLEPKTTARARQRAAPDHAPGTTSGERTIRGGIWFALSQYIPQLYTLALSVAAARFLTPAELGRQSYIAFLSLSVAAVLSAPFFVSLLRSVGESLGRGEPGVARGLVRWVWLIQAGLVPLAVVLFVALAAAGAGPPLAWVLAGAVTGCTMLQVIPSAALAGLQRWHEAAIPGLVTGPVGVAVTIGALAAGGGIVAIFAVELAVVIVNLVWTSALAERRLAAVSRDHRRPPAALRRALIRYAGVSAVGVLLEVIVARRSELFILERWSTEEQIAVFSIAFSAVMAISQIPRGLGSSIAPSFATLVGAGEHDRVRRGFQRAARLLLTLSLPLTALAVVSGPDLIRAVYGHAYEGTRPVFLVLALTLPIAPVAGLAGGLLNGWGNARVPLVASIAAGVVDIGLALILIPRYEAVGAAVANLAGFAVAVAGTLGYCLRETAPVDLRLEALVQGLLASTMAAATGFLVVERLGTVPGMLLGGAAVVLVYAGAARAFGVLSADDSAWLSTALGSRLGTRAALIDRFLSIAPGAVRGRALSR